MAAEGASTRPVFRRASWSYGEALWDLERSSAPRSSPLQARDAVALPQFAAQALSSGERTRILELGKHIASAPSAVDYAHARRRKADSRWILPDEEWLWLYERIERLFTDANAQFGYRISSFVDPILLADYPAGVGFDWHLDTVTGVTSTRKISLTIPLSAGEEYAGGDLEIAPFGMRPEARIAGNATLFPSFLCHRVTPITRGRRIALVAWAHGPAFS
jgi:PKHD-type hydroxylase